MISKNVVFRYLRRYLRIYSELGGHSKVLTFLDIFVYMGKKPFLKVISEKRPLSRNVDIFDLILLFIYGHKTIFLMISKNGFYREMWIFSDIWAKNDF